MTENQRWFLLIAGIIIIFFVSLSYINHKFPGAPKTTEQINSEIKLKEEAKRNDMYKDCLRTIDAYGDAKGSESQCFKSVYGESK